MDFLSTGQSQVCCLMFLMLQQLQLHVHHAGWSVASVYSQVHLPTSDREDGFCTTQNSDTLFHPYNPDNYAVSYSIHLAVVLFDLLCHDTLSVYCPHDCMPVHVLMLNSPSSTSRANSTVFI